MSTEQLTEEFHPAAGHTDDWRCVRAADGLSNSAVQNSVPISSQLLGFRPITAGTYKQLVQHPPIEENFISFRLTTTYLWFMLVKLEDTTDARL